MTRSRYFELLDKESKMPRTAPGVFGSADDLFRYIDQRASLAREFQVALDAGEITESQYQTLMKHNQQHSLPQQGRTTLLQTPPGWNNTPSGDKGT